MPSGLERFYGRGHLHFITASCYCREALFGTAWRRDLFVKVLEQVRRRYQLVLVGYVVMPEHFHLLISEPERGNPSVVIQALKLGVARRILAVRKRQERRQRNQPSLWQDTASNRIWKARFYDFNVWSGRVAQALNDLMKWVPHPFAFFAKGWEAQPKFVIPTLRKPRRVGHPFLL